MILIVVVDCFDIDSSRSRFSTGIIQRFMIASALGYEEFTMLRRLLYIGERPWYRGQNTICYIILTLR